MTNLNPPVVRDWAARYSPDPADFNTYIRDTFNFLSAPPVFRSLQTTQQSIPTSASGWVVCELNDVLEDSFTGWTSGTGNKYTAQVAGRYQLTFNLWASPVVLDLLRVGFQYNINGTTVGPYELERDYAGQTIWSWGCYAEIYLAAGDWVQPVIYNESAATVNSYVATTGEQSSFEAVWVSE
jgi:hypothetical protein